MKRNIFFILGLFILNSLSSQTYFPFPENNASWLVKAWWPDGGPDGLSSLYDYQVTGDTIINSYTYHKLNTINYSGETPPFFGQGYIGAYRNDTFNRKIFYYPKDSLQEYILYDFNLNIGDTIKGYMRDFNHWALTDPNEAIITSIDSILIDGVYHKRFNYNSSSIDFNNGSLIEGIGNTNGLIEGIWSHIDFYNYLSCFQEGGMSLYTFDACYVGINSFNKNEIEFYPNPFHDFVTIPITYSVQKIIITDLLGNIELFITNPTKTLDLSSLSKGVYIIELSSNENIFTTKIIKN